MEFPRYKFTTSRNLVYSYIFVSGSPSSSSPPSTGPTADPTATKEENEDETGKKPMILFLHGFPSLAVDFKYQLQHFLSLGYSVLAPDLIGYGESSRPSDHREYRHKLIAEDLRELVECVCLLHETGREKKNKKNEVIGVAHDFGAQILTRFDMYFPHVLSKLVFLTIGPVTVGQEFNLDLVNGMTKEMLGYHCFGYQDFLVREADATDLLVEKHDSFVDLVFATDHELWKKNFGEIGGLRKWLEDGRRCDTLGMFDMGLRETHRVAFRRDQGGYHGVRCWYEGLVNNVNIPDDRARLQELGVDQYTFVVGKKVLLITAGRDTIAIPQAQIQMTQSCVNNAEADLQIHNVEAGHWVGIEAADAVNNLIENFIH